ncbi:MAG TPA: hypothetical protein VNZ64_16830 [Candidatus Acidoferrum sp.]|jgi:hypothetical protein|nr:hypothetical protein [Candidatus Acidoferrum sp.]
MKAWFTKFRISAVLDSRKPLSQSLRDAVARSEELQRFEKSAGALGRVLKETPPPASVPPPGLHQAIMRAVRAGAQPAAPARKAALWRRLPAPALAALVLVAVWWALGPGRDSSRRPATEREGLGRAVAVLELGERVTQRMPSQMVAPLSEEWQRLNGDFDRTQEFLLASLP